MSTSAEQAAPAQVSAEDFAEILRATRACVRERVVPRETEIMDKDEVPTDIRSAAAELGLFGYLIVRFDVRRGVERASPCVRPASR